MQKKTHSSKATRTIYTILRQISTLVPREFVNASASPQVKAMADGIKQAGGEFVAVALPRLLVVSISR